MKVVDSALRAYDISPEDFKRAVRDGLEAGESQPTEPIWRRIRELGKWTGKGTVAKKRLTEMLIDRVTRTYEEEAKA